MKIKCWPISAVQFSGNKWTQFPIEKTVKEKINFPAKKNVIKQYAKSTSKIK